MFSVIYTPTEGEAIQNYSKLFRRPEGCFLNIEDQGRIEDDLDQFGDPDDIDVIVVSDGEQVSNSESLSKSAMLKFATDPGHWRSRCWCHTHQRR